LNNKQKLQKVKQSRIMVKTGQNMKHNKKKSIWNVYKNTDIRAFNKK